MANGMKTGTGNSGGGCERKNRRTSESKRHGAAWRVMCTYLWTNRIEARSEHVYF